MKSTIENLQLAVQGAKNKQKLAQEEVTKLERDMEEFKNNKEGKIEELKVSFAPVHRVAGPRLSQDATTV